METLILVLCALALDLALGDPRRLPHPVRGLGRLIASLERALRARYPSRERAAGVALALGVVGGTYMATWGTIHLAGLIHAWAARTLEVLAIYWSLAPRDLWQHAARVSGALGRGDLAEAKRGVAMMVGRDVEPLDEKGVTRATIESVAENTVDGVTAPLCFALLGGGPLAMAYRAINTLDSLVGYKTEPYARIGWASARLDDLANLVPARLTALLMPLAGGLLGGSARGGWAAAWRDGRKHDSPNSGLTEAAMAGVLGIELGGPHWYRGTYYASPTIGIARRPVERADIARTCRVMAATTAMVFVIGVAARLWIGP
ncbi:MAG: cobalamin biosynthesis protein CobD [Nitrospirae bacterium]|nr:cobalamin biosynthesis protein CobD [Nitrospirota bacterium]